VLVGGTVSSNPLSSSDESANWANQRRKEPVDKAKPFDIPKREVWEAFKRVKAKQGAAGVDGQSIADFEVDLDANRLGDFPNQSLCRRLHDMIPAGKVEKASASEPSMKCRKRIRRCRNRGVTLPPGSARETPEACPSGIRHVGGAKLNQALVRNVRTCRSDAKGDVQAANTARTRVPKRSTGAEQLVVGMKVL
jgi:hypothetical protein